MVYIGQGAVISDITENILTAYLATDEIHQLQRLRLEGIPERLSRSYWLVCQRVAVV